MTPLSQPTRTALVTGGAGFIGSSIVHALLEQGDKVRIIDDLSTGKLDRLDDIKNQIELIEGSILDQNTLKKAMNNCDVIFHLAAKISVPESINDPQGYQTTNGNGTLAIAETARQLGIERIVYSSTSAIYGEDPRQPKVENHYPDPISPYAISKYTGEMYLMAYAKLHGMKNVALRYFNVFGPGQDPKSQYGAAIPNMVTRILNNDPPIIYGDGDQTRDFVYIGNVVQANLKASLVEQGGIVANVGCGGRVKVNDIVNTTNDLLGTDVKPQYEPERVGDIRHSTADITVAREKLGYEPEVDFTEGMKRSIEYYKNL